MSKRGMPFMQVYVDDILSDVALSMATHTTRDIWFTSLLMMWKATKRGVLEGTLEQLVGLYPRTTLDELDSAFSEIKDLGIGTVARDSHGVVTVTNRRMVREERERQQARVRKQRQRERDGNEGEATDLSRESHGSVTRDIPETIDHKPETIEEKPSVETPLPSIDEGTEIFEFWNSQPHLHTHLSMTPKHVTGIKGALKTMTVDEVKETITNYNTILGDSKYKLTYKWTLEDFLKRQAESFLTLNDPFTSWNWNNSSTPDPTKKAELILKDGETLG